MKTTKPSSSERSVYDLAYWSNVSDVVLVIHSKDGSKEKIPDHKFILIVGSDYFKNMFMGDLANDSKEQDIHEEQPI